MKHLDAISCIIPNYNGRSLLEKHLPSVIEALQSGDELVIVDDNSTDDSVEWLIATFSLERIKVEPPNVPLNYAVASSKPEIYKTEKQFNKKNICIVLVSLQNNERFALASNTGVLYSNSKYFFLCNSDVTIDSAALNVLRQQMASDDQIFAIGTLEYENTKSGEKSGKNVLWFEKGLFQHSKALDFKSGETAWASGGSALYSKEKWLSLNGFDRLFYPAYWEDIDISLRAREHGWKVLFNADAVVYHKHESTNKKVFKQGLDEMSWRNAFSFSWKNGNLLQKASFLFWYPYWYVQRLRIGSK